MIITATIYPELEITIEGEVEPSQRQYSDCPGHDAFVGSFSVEKIEVGGVNLLDGLKYARGDALYEFLLRLERAVTREAEAAIMEEYNAD